ncbi:MAG: GAF domain-containing protein [Gammaproteobacteria bacterium]|nr:GAF domain-containing protein [Gammaproteobacteria bacterium]
MCSVSRRRCRMPDTDFDLLRSQLAALTDGESDALANASNFVALLYHALDDVNWLGIYVLRNDELVLGPFQGMPACVRIAMGKGVCGTAAASRQTQRVADVHQFPGHIVCDAASRSELVVPLIADERLIGVLDIDSPLENRFTAADQAGVEKLCENFCRSLPANKSFI